MFSNMEPRNSNEMIEPRVNFEDIPLSALQQKSRKKLSVLLNPKKVLVTEDGYCRDWRGIFDLSGMTQSEQIVISQTDDKMGKLLDLWNQKIDENNSPVTLSQLQHCFGIIDRYDVYDDTLSLFVEDSQAYLTKSRARSLNENAKKFEIIKREPDSDIITMKDVESSERGEPLPIYDAFVIYSDKDIEFATELIERLEKIGYMLCIKDRDLLPGLSFESDAILSLLSQRCNHLIIIVSKDFLESPMKIFITNFAQALGIEQNKRKIIPCVLEPGCDLPQMLRYCFRLDYFRRNKLFDFWEKLDKSLKVNTKAMNSIDKHSMEKITSTNFSNKTANHNELVYKFSETPTTPEKTSKKLIPIQEVAPQQQKIMPPLPKLRPSSSMVSLEIKPNGLQYQNKHSHSTLELNGECSMEMTQSTKLKRKKWYSMFIPKEMKLKSNEAEVKEEKEKKKHKRHWFKSKKKQKEKLPVLAES